MVFHSMRQHSRLPNLSFLKVYDGKQACTGSAYREWLIPAGSEGLEARGSWGGNRMIAAEKPKVECFCRLSLFFLVLGRLLLIRLIHAFSPASPSGVGLPSGEWWMYNILASAGCGPRNH